MQKSSEEYRYLESLFQDCKIVELRAIERGKAPLWKWHNDPDSLIQQARQWSGERVLLCTTMALPIHSIPAGQVPDWVQNPERYAVPWAPKASLRDADVANYERLLFDFDRKEKADCNASDDELAEADDLRGRFVEYMTAMGFPAPALATSGNGLHALYRVRMTSCDEIRDALGQLYSTASDTFRSKRFKLDTTTRNAAQACRLYGALNRKFPATEGRPQRKATILLPDDWMDTNCMPSSILMEAFPKRERPKLSVVPRTSSKHGDWKTLDIVSWFQANGLYLKPLTSGKHAVTCPWQQQGAHDKTSYSDTVVWETSRSGLPSFHCSHDTCAGRGSLVDLDAVMGGIADFCGGRRHG